MTVNDIPAIHRLASRSTGTPWILIERKDNGRRVLAVIADGHGDEVDYALVAEVPLEPGDDNVNDWRNDAEFIAAARTHVPNLCDEVEQLRAELAKAGEQVTALTALLAQSRTNAATYANEVGNLTAENARVRQQRDAHTAVVEAAKAWREAYGSKAENSAGNRGTALVAAVDALPKAEVAS